VVLGIGMDLVEVGRIERMILEKGDRALRRLFTPREIEYAARRAHPAQHYAARFAAKEAAYKALSGDDDVARAVGWRDVEVVPTADGRPTLVFHGAAAERAVQLGVARVLVTLTHTDGVAGAMVVLEG
jgi:holo-[acyl-carrier protein] synthase